MLPRVGSFGKLSPGASPKKETSAADAFSEGLAQLKRSNSTKKLFTRGNSFRTLNNEAEPEPDLSNQVVEEQVESFSPKVQDVPAYFEPDSTELLTEKLIEVMSKPVAKRTEQELFDLKWYGIKHEYLSLLEKRARDVMCGALHYRSIEKGQVLVEEGQVGGCWYIVFSGELSVHAKAEVTEKQNQSLRSSQRRMSVTEKKQRRMSGSETLDILEVGGEESAEVKLRTLVASQDGRNPNRRRSSISKGPVAAGGEGKKMTFKDAGRLARSSIGMVALTNTLRRSSLSQSNGANAEGDEQSRSKSPSPTRRSSMMGGRGWGKHLTFKEATQKVRMMAAATHAFDVPKKSDAEMRVEKYGPQMAVFTLGTILGDLQECSPVTAVAMDHVQYGLVSPQDLPADQIDFVMEAVMKLGNLTQYHKDAFKEKQGERSDKSLLLLYESIKGFPFFQQLSKEGTRRMCNNMELKDIPAGHVLVTEGHMATSFQVILRGSLSIYVTKPGTASGFEQVKKKAEVAKEMNAVVAKPKGEVSNLERINAFGQEMGVKLQPGEGIGERSLTQGSKATATLVANVPSTLLVLDKEDFLSEMRTTSIVFQPGKLCHLLEKPASERAPDDLKYIRMSLAQNHFFKKLETKIQEQVLPVLGHKSLQPDEVLFCQGEEGNHFYVILTGSVSIHQFEGESPKLEAYKKSYDPKQHTYETFFGTKLAVLKAGASFGELALILNKPRAATIVAKERCELMVLSRAEYSRLMSGSHQGALQAKVSYLQALSIFKGYPHRKLIGLTFVIEAQRYPYNQVVISEGGTAPGISFVVSGQAKLSQSFHPTLSSGGRPRKINVAMLGPGEFYGEFSILGKEGVKTTSEFEVLAATALEIYLMKSDVVMSLPPAVMRGVRSAADIAHKFRAQHLAQTVATLSHTPEGLERQQAAEVPKGNATAAMIFKGRNIHPSVAQTRAASARSEGSTKRSTSPVKMARQREARVEAFAELATLQLSEKDESPLRRAVVHKAVPVAAASAASGRGQASTTSQLRPTSSTLPSSRSSRQCYIRGRESASVDGAADHDHAAASAAAERLGSGQLTQAVDAHNTLVKVNPLPENMFSKEEARLRENLKKQKLAGNTSLKAYERYQQTLVDYQYEMTDLVNDVMTVCKPVGFQGFQTQILRAPENEDFCNTASTPATPRSPKSRYGQNEHLDHDRSPSPNGSDAGDQTTKNFLRQSVSDHGMKNMKNLNREMREIRKEVRDDMLALSGTVSTKRISAEMTIAKTMSSRYRGELAAAFLKGVTLGTNTKKDQAAVLLGSNPPIHRESICSAPGSLMDRNNVSTDNHIINKYGKPKTGFTSERAALRNSPRHAIASNYSRDSQQKARDNRDKHKSKAASPLSSSTNRYFTGPLTPHTSVQSPWSSYDRGEYIQRKQIHDFRKIRSRQRTASHDFEEREASVYNGAIRVELTSRPNTARKFTRSKSDAK